MIRAARGLVSVEGMNEYVARARTPVILRAWRGEPGTERAAGNPKSTEDVMRVVVDLQLCEGNSRCAEAASDVFEVRDDDKSHVLMERPSEALRERVKLAARLCPRQAISIVED